MTFWPRLAISRNDLGNLVKVKDMFTLRPAPGTEFRGGSCCGSQIGWGPHICKVLSGCITADSKTPMARDPGLGLSPGLKNVKKNGKDTLIISVKVR